MAWLLFSLAIVVLSNAPNVAHAPSPTPLPSPMERASITLDGLVQYYLQTEAKNRPRPKPSNCPCFSCDGSNCTIPECSYCATQPSGCPTKNSDGCYTTASSTCLCDLPPGTPPPGSNTPAQFFFSCGQMGGLAPFGASCSVDTCLCESDWAYSCTNCFRWFSALAMESSVNYCMELGRSPNSTGVCGQIHDAAVSMWLHSPYNGYWDGGHHPVYVDDFAWYALAYLRVYAWTGDEVWRERAAGIHDWAFKYGWDYRLRADINQSCGGFWWNIGDQFHFKDSITIVETLYSAVKLAQVLTSTTEHNRFMASAVEIWDWIFAFDGGRGLLAENGIMSTGAVPQHCCHPLSASREKNMTYPRVECANSRVAGMSYNHGILMSSAALLYNITADKKYLQTAISLLESAMENLTDSTGAMIDPQRGARIGGGCGGGDPGSDFFSFKGVFVMHLGYFAQVLYESNALPSDAHAKLLSFLEINSANVWTKAIVKAPFTGSGDICALSSSVGEMSIANRSAAAPPKFHWWWSNDNGSLQIPPDGRVWFTNSDIACLYEYHNDTGSNVSHLQPILWVGFRDSVDTCRADCANHTECTKYMYRNSASSTCLCFRCWGEPCQPPNCTYCSTAGKRTCPHKTSKGCYTSSSSACACSDNQPMPKGNCFLYRLVTQGNRSTMPACTTYSQGDVPTLGIKRPPSPRSNDPASSCRNRCGNTSSTVRNGTAILNITCQCDTACARHFDCCLDYVEECMPADEQNPTCRGHCNSGNPEKSKGADNLGIPIPGGGYCYCGGSCNFYYTDNNSYGSCCADHAVVCDSAARNTVCLDPRSQTQALQLFIAHHVVMNMTVSVP